MTAGSKLPKIMAGLDVPDSRREHVLESNILVDAINGMFWYCIYVITQLYNTYTAYTSYSLYMIIGDYIYIYMQTASTYPSRNTFVYLFRVSTFNIYICIIMWDTQNYQAAAAISTNHFRIFVCIGPPISPHIYYLHPADILTHVTQHNLR